MRALKELLEGIYWNLSHTYTVKVDDCDHRFSFAWNQGLLNNVRHQITHGRYEAFKFRASKVFNFSDVDNYDGPKEPVALEKVHEPVLRQHIKSGLVGTNVRLCLNGPVVVEHHCVVRLLVVPLRGLQVSD